MGGWGVGEFQLYKTSAEQGRVKVSGKKKEGWGEFMENFERN